MRCIGTKETWRRHVSGKNDVYQTVQRSASGLTIGEPSLQLNACLNSGKLESGPITRYLPMGCGSPWTHGTLRFRTNLISAPLPPGNKELLLRRVTVDGWLRVRLFGFFESEKSDLCAGEIANAFTQNQLAVVVNARLERNNHRTGAPRRKCDLESASCPQESTNC